MSRTFSRCQHPSGAASATRPRFPAPLRGGGTRDPLGENPKGFVVVGASTGLGRATARALARDHRVIVAGRDPHRTRAAVPGAHAVLAVDLCDLADVRRFGDELAALGPLDGIVCNAGVQSSDARRTRDGFDETFAVNHLAHFAIVSRALPALVPGARVVWIGSGTLDPDDAGARRLGFRGGQFADPRALAAGIGDPSASEAQRGRDRYATSKLCNLLAMDAFARRVPAERLGAFAFDPGLMPGTGLARDHGWLARVAWHTLLRAAALVLPGTSTANRSGRALAWLLTTPSLAGTTNRYFDYRRREREPCAIARRRDHADELYATSLALCGIARDPLAPAVANVAS